MRNMKNQMTEMTERLLAMNPEPAARYALLRLTGAETDRPDMRALYGQVLQNKQIRKMEDMQREDGCWPPFHGQTEAMIRRLVSFGLDGNHPALKRAEGYLVRLLKGEASTGQYEVQDDPRWYPVMFEPLIAAAMLSLIDPVHELVHMHRSRWAAFAESAYATGRYDEDADRAAKAASFGFSVKRTLPPHNYYSLILLAPRGGETYLSKGVSRALIEHCLYEENAMGYVYNERPGSLVPIGACRRDSRDFWHWIRALSILAPYEGWEEHEERFSGWILSQRNENGLFCFPKKFDFSLSGAWRGVNREIDSTLFVLRMLLRAGGL